MVDTSFIDTDMRIRSVQARTDDAGAAADDLSGEEDRLINAVLTEGLVRPADGWELAPDTGMNLTLGSGSAKSDVYVVEGDAGGQLPYMVRLEATSVQVSVPAADGSQQRIDEVWLVVQDHAYDGSNRGLPRIGYRTGDPGGGNPGPDAGWEAKALLWRVTVPAGATEIGAGNLSDQRVQSRVRTLVEFLQLTGGTLVGGGKIADPTNPTSVSHLTRKAYVDAQRDTRVAKAGDDMAGNLRIQLVGVPAFTAHSDGNGRGALECLENGHVRVAVRTNGGTLLYGVRLERNPSLVRIEADTVVEGDLTVDGNGVHVPVADNYTGDGATNRLISLPFTPKKVEVHQRASQHIRAYSALGVIGTSGWGHRLRPGTDVIDQSQDRVLRPELVAGGFRVGDASGSATLNNDGDVYDYIAFG